MHGTTNAPSLAPPGTPLPTNLPEPDSQTSRPILRDGRILLRPFQRSDAPAVFEAVRESLPELSNWMIWCHPGYSLDDTLTFISKSAEEWEQGIQYSFAILDEKDGAFLGSVGISAVNKIHGCANLGYWVRAGRTRLGIATAATCLAAQFGLVSLKLQRLELLVPTSNKPSQRVAEKAGAKWEGVSRRRLRLQGFFHDAAVYSLVLADLILPLA